MEAGEGLGQLRRVGSEDFLVGDTGSACLGERLNDRPGIARICHGGHPRRVTVLQTLTCRGQVITGTSSVLDLPEMPDPGRKFAIGYLSLETGELEVSMGVDQSGKKDAVCKLERRQVRRTGDLRVWAYGFDPALRTDQQGAVLNWRKVDRQ